MSEIKLHLGDCLEILPTIEAESVDLIFADPPYNIGKAEWDKIDNYLVWCNSWIAECSRVLKPNGAFWISHSKPLVLAKLSELIGKHGWGMINWITWDKSQWSYVKKFKDAGTRAFIDANEYLIFHADEGEWTSQCDRQLGFIFEPLRKYLSEERNRAGYTTRQVAEQFQQKTRSRTVTGMARHWFKKVQWSLPTEENYQWLRGLFNRNSVKYLRREYEDLRREYKYLRYTFNNPGKVSSVWQFPPAKPNGHPTPKPEPLLERIIKSTSNEGDMVLDPFMGSGTTGAVCQRLKRNFIGIDNNKKYHDYAQKRIQDEKEQYALLEIA